MRFLTPSKETIDFPLRTFYRSAEGHETDHLRHSVTKDLTLVHASMAYSDQTAERFYSGYDTGWGGIVNRMDARRKVTDDLLFKGLFENETPSGPLFSSRAVQLGLGRQSL